MDLRPTRDDDQQMSIPHRPPVQLKSSSPIKQHHRNFRPVVITVQSSQESALTSVTINENHHNNNSIAINEIQSNLCIIIKFHSTFIFFR